MKKRGVKKIESYIGLGKADIYIHSTVLIYKQNYIVSLFLKLKERQSLRTTALAPGREVKDRSL